MAAKTHTVAIEISGAIIKRAYIYVTPGQMCSPRWYTVSTTAHECDTLAQAQAWLAEHIGITAEEHQIHRDY